MILSEHKKHAAITRPAIGNFARNEWAFVGGPCTVIKALADRLTAALSPQYQCAYADTSHHDDITQLPGRLGNDAAMEYTDQINYSQLNYLTALNPFKQRELFTGMDLVMVNGNHQQAKAQVVIIDINKRASLQKRITALTDVQLILLMDNADEVFDFIKDEIPGFEEISVYNINDTKSIISFFQAKLEQAKPVLNGLILAGGKSTRMGIDKGAINWHGKEQRYYLADLLKNYCSEVFISCRDGVQKREIDPAYPTFEDTFTGLGPYGGILSAFREQPDAAWLVVACDLPLLNEEIIAHLIANRNNASLATAYQSETSDMPEPLITIWEPKSYQVLLNFLAQGYSCPRKVLLNTDITLLHTPVSGALTNVNTPGDLEQVKRIIHQQMAKSNAS